MSVIDIIVTRSAVRDRRIPIDIWRNTKRTFDGLALDVDGDWICTIGGEKSEVDHLSMNRVEDFIYLYEYTPRVGTEIRKRFKEVQL